jgi:plasmid stabilization system protein ParE
VRLRFLTPARQEFLAAVRYYERARSGLGSEFIDEIEDVLAELTTSPWSGSPFGEGARRRLLRRLPFEVVYSVGEDEILVLAVAHQSRRPFYWHDRLD